MKMAQHGLPSGCMPTGGFKESGSFPILLRYCAPPPPTFPPPPPPVPPFLHPWGLGHQPFRKERCDALKASHEQARAVKWQSYSWGLQRKFGCGSKHGTLVEGNMDQSLRFPGGLILTASMVHIRRMVAKSISHHFETMGNHLFVGICRGIIIPGFLGVAKWISQPSI